MKSIRLSLMVYFLALLAVALFVASLLVYRTAERTLEAKRQAPVVKLVKESRRGFLEKRQHAAEPLDEIRESFRLAVHGRTRLHSALHLGVELPNDLEHPAHGLGGVEIIVDGSFDPCPGL